MISSGNAQACDGLPPPIVFAGPLEGGVNRREPRDRPV